MHVEQFDVWALLPENAGRNYEYIAGEVVEKRVANAYSSIITARVTRFVGGFIDDHDLGYVTNAVGGYVVNDERYIPDMGYIARQRQPEPPNAAYNPNAPDLAVEGVSPTDDLRELLIKVLNYLLAGTTVWVFDPLAKDVTVCEPGKKPHTLRADDTLNGGVLHGFSLSLKRIYKERLM
jgi:Uma2 family endonuclease